MDRTGTHLMGTRSNKCKCNSFSWLMWQHQYELHHSECHFGSVYKIQFLPTVRCRAPAAVRVSHEPPPQHELLVLVHECPVAQDHADVVWVKALRALRAADVDARLWDLNAQVLAEAIDAGAVVTGHDVGEALPGVAQKAQRALQ